jgi:putative oxidoreductase
MIVTRAVIDHARPAEWGRSKSLIDCNICETDPPRKESKRMKLSTVREPKDSKPMRRRIEAILSLLNRQQWVAQLLIRLFVGYFFMETGWGKLHNLDGFAQRFAGWGIPYPQFNAALSAYTEFIGGLLTIFGTGTRLISIPMMINMLVAILKVNLKGVTSLDDFAELDEPLYALTYLWLLFSGPGWVSVDYLLSRFFVLAEPRAGGSLSPQDKSARWEATPGITEATSQPGSFGLRRR